MCPDNPVETDAAYCMDLPARVGSPAMINRFSDCMAVAAPGHGGDVLKPAGKAEFARPFPDRLVSHGMHMLRGASTAQELFTLSPAPRPGVVRESP